MHSELSVSPAAWVTALAELAPATTCRRKLPAALRMGRWGAIHPDRRRRIEAAARDPRAITHTAPRAKVPWSIAVRLPERVAVGAPAASLSKLAPLDVSHAVSERSGRTPRAVG